MRGARFFRPWFDLVGAPPPLREMVLTELASPARYWHGLLHHALMLRQLARADVTVEELRRLVLATLFHDIVYDATRPDNEERSAEVARHWLADDADVRRVAAMILTTKHHHLDTDPVTRSLLEADLSVLWTPSKRLYAYYAAGIRAEYAHVPAPAYRAGRTAVLSTLREGLASALPADRVAFLTRNLDREIVDLAEGHYDRPR